jgi:hypothetical protein
MNICIQVDDIVWSDSRRVWEETFDLVLLKTFGLSHILNEVMQWILFRVAEYESMHKKVVRIIGGLKDTEGVRKLAIHYHDIMSRYRLAYDSCKLVEFI